MQYQLKVSDGLIASSNIYKIKFRAMNDFGYSDFSEELNVGVSSFPA
jgi:hypothetical protein